MNIGEKVITGEWDGIPIMRRRTAQEVLLNELQKMESKEENETKKSAGDCCELCDGTGTVKVGDFDNIKEIDCPQCSCRFCNKQNCECDNGQEN